MNKSNDGCIYTKKWVVDMMLDLLGYTPNKNLKNLKVVEPACGEGSFTSEIVSRLLQSVQNEEIDIQTIKNCLRFYETDSSVIEQAKNITKSQLRKAGLQKEDAINLINAWYVNGDFVDSNLQDVDIVVGNPPYIRATEIPIEKRQYYSSKLKTFSMGTDIYIAFYEKGLRMLGTTGKLAYICSDRWQKNQYGKKLREFIKSQYYVSYNIIMHNVDAFESKVTAYPAITIIQKEKTELLEINCKEQFDSSNVKDICQLGKNEVSQETSAFIIKSDKKIKYKEMPTLLEAGINVGIGVATGRDSIFVVDKEIDIEEDRLLPLAYAKDIEEHHFPINVNKRLVNPWNENRELVSLENYPKLQAYFLKNRSILTERHIAQRNINNWYRTIDKVDVALTNKKKLLIRDMGNRTEPIFDDGKLYPHHNLYWLTSDVWDLETLGGILISEVVKNMMSQMSVSMRGGVIRNQAQYLRRIRVPMYKNLETSEIKELKLAYRTWNIDKASEITERIYSRYE